MSKQDAISAAASAATQSLMHLALLSLTEGSAADAAAILRVVATAAETPAKPHPVDGVTLRLDQIQVKGAGRRPTSLVNREVTVVSTWQVVAQHEDGTVTAVLTDSPATAKAGRGKKRVKA